VAEKSVYYRTAESIGEGKLPIGEMSFFGPVIPGRPNVTLYGTAESIYKQVLELNPNHDPWDFPGYKEKMEARGISRESYGTTFDKRGQLDARQKSVCFINFCRQLQPPIRSISFFG
jgi:hypothetical protein